VDPKRRIGPRGGGEVGGVGVKDGGDELLIARKMSSLLNLSGEQPHRGDETHRPRGEQNLG